MIISFNGWTELIQLVVTCLFVAMKYVFWECELEEEVERIG